MSGVPAAARPRISIVISVLNGAATLERCLASVLEQDWPETETIVIDGGSTDGTPATLERFRPHLAWCESKPDRGIYHAWNKALDHATGDWIAFLGADDRIRDRRVLARLAPVLSESAGRWLVVYASATNAVLYERRAGTVTLEIRAPKLDGSVPLEADRGGAVKPREPASLE